MATDEFKDKSSFAVRTASVGWFVGWGFLFACALTSVGWGFLRGSVWEKEGLAPQSLANRFCIDFLESCRMIVVLK